jgi:hypothetical protein
LQSKIEARKLNKITFNKQLIAKKQEAERLRAEKAEKERQL